MRTIGVLCHVTLAAAGSIELVSGNLGNGGISLDNIKGKWSQALKIFGRDTTLSAEYDRGVKEDFLSEVSVSGESGKLKYTLTNKFESATAFEVSTTTNDGTTLEAEGSFDGLNSGLALSKVSAARSVSVRDQDCDLSLEHDLEKTESKLKLSTLLGSGVKAVGLITSAGGSGKASYELEYDTALSAGRTLSASVSPADGTGEIDYEDSDTLDATIKVNFPLGGSPKATIQRSFSF